MILVVTHEALHSFFFLLSNTCVNYKSINPIKRYSSEKVSSHMILQSNRAVSVNLKISRRGCGAKIEANDNKYSFV